MFEWSTWLSAQEYVGRLRVDRGSTLFGRTDLSMSPIAGKRGSCQAVQLAGHDRPATGRTPMACRRESRAYGPALPSGGFPMRREVDRLGADRRTCRSVERVCPNDLGGAGSRDRSPDSLDPRSATSYSRAAWDGPQLNSSPPGCRISSLCHATRMGSLRHPSPAGRIGEVRSQTGTIRLSLIFFSVKLVLIDCTLGSSVRAFLTVAS